MIVYTAPAEISEPNFLTDDGRYDRESYDQECKRYAQELSEYAKTRGGKHPLAGKMVSRPVADGSADYIIIKVQGKVGLIHMAWGDAWRDGYFEKSVTVKLLTELAYAPRGL